MWNIYSDFFPDGKVGIDFTEAHNKVPRNKKELDATITFDNKFNFMFRL